MDIESLGFKMEENILTFLLQPQFQQDIENARNFFYNHLSECNLNDEMLLDFNAWLISDYRLKDGETFCDKYLHFVSDELTTEENEFLEEKAKSYLSVYELIETNGKEGLLKDIFTRKEFWVDGTQVDRMEMKDMVLTRLIKISNGYNMLGSKVFIPSVFKNAISRNIVLQYEDYKNKSQYGNWMDFLRNHSILLYKYLGIILDVVNSEESHGDDYAVWQSVYLIKDMRNFKKILLQSKFVQLDYEEKGSAYFRLYNKGEILGEIVLKNNQMEIECISEADREKAKKLMEPIIGDLAKHYKDEVFGLDGID